MLSKDHSEPQGQCHRRTSC